MAILLNKRLKYLGFANNPSEATPTQNTINQTQGTNKKKCVFFSFKNLVIIDVFSEF